MCWKGTAPSGAFYIRIRIGSENAPDAAVKEVKNAIQPGSNLETELELSVPDKSGKHTLHILIDLVLEDVLELRLRFLLELVLLGRGHLAAGL